MSAACCAPRCTRFSEQIAGDPFIDAAGARGAAAGRHLREGAVRVLLLGQHHPDLPGRCADQRGLPVPFAAVRPGVVAQRLRALRLRLRAAHRPPPRQGDASAGRRRPGGQRGVELRQGPFGVHLRHGARPAHASAGARRGPGELRPASLAGGVRGRGARTGRGARARVGVLTGGRLTVEDAYAYSKFARVALGTNDIDFRARAHSAEEADFLGAVVAGQADRRDVRRPGQVRDGGAGRLRARGGVADRLPPAPQGGPGDGSRRFSSIAPFTSPGLAKLDGTLIRTGPGGEAAALADLAGNPSIGPEAVVLARGAPRDGRRRAVGGRDARADHRSQARVGPAPGGRTGRRRRGLPARAAAGRPLGRRCRGESRRRDGLGRLAAGQTGPRRVGDPRRGGIR